MSFVMDNVVQLLTMDERFWLSPGMTWERVRDRGPNGDVLKPVPRDFIWVLVLAGFFILGRKFFERFIAYPLGRHFCVKNKVHRRPADNDVLEEAFSKGRRPSETVVLGLAKSVDWTERAVQRWFRQRRLAGMPSNMIKFKEGLWRLFCYTGMLVFGSIVLLNKGYWSDTLLCWEGLPERAMEVDLFWYYMVELGFYASLCISQFYDIQRKDFWEMLAHHVATMCLLSFSFITNYLPLGALIMYIHDWADPLLEFAKLLGYTRQPGDGRTVKQWFGEAVFVLFMLTFWYSRLYVFPTRFVRSAYYEMVLVLGESWPMHKVLVSLLGVLCCLHVFWSYHIMRVLICSIIAGKVQGDSRSDDESEEHKPHQENGHRLSSSSNTNHLPSRTNESSPANGYHDSSPANGYYASTSTNHQ